ncbi:MAG: sugar phosphate nucleotidyltransferase [Acidobacteriota bacterium]|nr:sugar phosphate nucleotidyltransferase [Acidobacteriota bacterium]
MQCVILAGGLGTRMWPLTETCPKTLLPVLGQPFAWHQMQWLASQGVGEVVYCIGHQGDQIKKYWATHPSPVPSLCFVDEGPSLRGTAGALKLAFDRGVLNETFLVLYGDSFLPIDFGPVWSAFQASGLPALMTVLRNDGRWDTSNVIYDGGHLLLYDKSPNPEMRYIDYGLSAFRRDTIASTEQRDLAAVFHNLSLHGQLAGYEVQRRFYEIGSPSGLRDFEEYLTTARASQTEPRPKEAVRPLLRVHTS